MPPSGSCSLKGMSCAFLIKGSLVREGLILNFRLYLSFNIKITLGLKPFAPKTCLNFCSQAPTGIPSATLRTVVTGGAEGDRSTKEESFTGFIWTFSVSGLTLFF